MCSSDAWRQRWAEPLLFHSPMCAGQRTNRAAGCSSSEMNADGIARLPLFFRRLHSNRQGGLLELEGTLFYFFFKFIEYMRS